MNTDIARPEDRLLTIRQVQDYSSLSRATIYRFMSLGRFPRPVKLTPNGRVGWRESEVRTWSASPLDWSRPNDF